MKEFIIPGAAVPKPRQTQRDRWAQRPCVMRYRAWADETRLIAGKLPEDACMVTLRFHLPMPASWTRARKQEMNGKFHNARPDIDNIIKACLDALWPTGDELIAAIDAAKFWATEKQARTEVRIN